MPDSQRRKPVSPSRLKRLGFYLIFARFAVLLFLSGITFILQSVATEAPRVEWIPAIPLGAIAINFFLLILNSLFGRMKAFQVFQLSIDLAVISLLVFYTGAVNSNFVFLYYALVIAAALLLSDWSSLVFASAATVLIAIATSFLPVIGSQGTSAKATFIILIAQSSGLHLVAYLSSALAISLYKERIFNEEILENITDALLVLNNTGRIAYMNPAAMRMLNLSEKDINSRFHDVFSKEGTKALYEVLKKDEEEDNVEMDIEPHKGTLIPVNMRASAIGKYGNLRAGTVILIEDLSMRRRLQEAEVLSKRLAEYSTISAGVAHEIRNPLASIRFAAQELSHDLSDPDLRNMADIITAESKRLNSMLSDFLTSTKIRQPKKQLVSPRKIFSETRDMVVAQSSKKVRYDIDVSANVEVWADPDQLRQIILNLSLNSVDAVKESVHIRLVAKKQNLSKFLSPQESMSRKLSSIYREGVSIVHTDDGPGISNEDLEKVVIPFYTTKEKGTGLGLSMAQNIVDSHGGFMWIDNKLPRGVSVKIWLPALTGKDS